ncbi:VWA domain-containing protein [Mycolicibacterium diernhoferi]|uniref:VWFA domain-containing protein n=3 Tax=Mycolicibacterium diernhoferi TaxID=1801 RepID=A0A1Q4H946_9MYCO|nr:substrate-binding domain-containing protein [Mycolicibacterium diernhoferi]OJZ63942.1 hypothetical protein BRW64_19580 [Mycolicibacterium diernhoferi]PEG55675.1 hypothetical protein CRI78_05305 [Mycolicibacterium diernhoferi]QYL20626.1 substrate-binding and VWA domain-containing protein [Mycolicibacterium diernhoferi]
MGRHSIPDPDDADDRGGNGTEPYRPEPDRESAADHGSTTGDEPAGDSASEFGDFGYQTDDYRSDDDYRADEYGTDDYRADDYRADDYDEPAPAPRGFPAVADEDQPTQAFSVTGRQRAFDNGEWTGSHRAVTTGRRKVSPLVIAALVTVVVVVGAVILWRFFGDALSNRSQASADRCVEGEMTVSVIADPAIADHVTTLAEQYSKDADPVGDRCVKVAVQAADSAAVINGFTETWPGDLGERPAMWIPASSVSEARLESVDDKAIIDSRPLVSTPVVVAARPELKEALAQQNWSTLPGLQSNPAGLDGLNLPGWGGLRLALPLTGDSDASFLAAEAVAAASAPAGAPPSDGAGAAQRLFGGQPELADTAADTALDTLINAADPATAPVHAVVTTEQKLVQRAADLPDAGAKLSAWIPPGPAAVADFPGVLLSGDWLSKEQVSAASEFDRYLRKPEQLAKLAEAGFRAEGTTPPSSPVTDFPQLAQRLSFGDAASRAALATRLTAPARDGAVTVVLNQSMPVDEGGRSRLSNVTTALNDRLQVLPPSTSVGLWTFDGVAGRSVTTTGPLGDDARSAALSSSLQGQTASGGGAVSFTTLRLVYGEAVTNFREGVPNSVLVITSGPHTDRSLDGPGLVSYIQGAVDEQRPVAVNVINLGDDPDRATWEAVAQASGGEYRSVPNSADPALADAVAELLG